MQVLQAAGSYTSPAGDDVHWIEHLRAPDLSVGTYSIPAGGTDDQDPHAEDEIYVITGGRAVLVAGDQRAPVGPGAVVYVPAAEVHRFIEVTQDLTALVVFAPAEGSRDAAR